MQSGDFELTHEGGHFRKRPRDQAWRASSCSRSPLREPNEKPLVRANVEGSENFSGCSQGRSSLNVTNPGRENAGRSCGARTVSSRFKAASAPCWQTANKNCGCHAASMIFTRCGTFI
jgi:hypothetical protein